MAELATYIGIEPRTAIVGAADILRGLRCVMDANGVVAVAPVGVRGDYITMTDGKIAEAVQVASLSGGGKVPAVASEAVLKGDLAYSAALGKASKTSAGAILLGRWTQPASGADVLSEIELFPVA